MYTIYGFEQFTKDEYLDFFKKLLLSNYQKEIKHVLNQPDPSLFYSLVVEFSMILEGDVNFGPLFIAEPNKLLPIFNEALLLSQKVIIENELNSKNRIENGTGSYQQDNLSQTSTTSSSVKINYILKKNCKIRVCDIPNYKEITHSSLPRSNQVGIFSEFRGTVIRSGHPRVLEKTKKFQCSKCCYQFDVSIDFEQYNQYNIPKKCPNDEFNCPVSYFKPLDIVGEHCDYQEIKVQEQIHKLSAGSIPGSIVVLLQEDLVDICQAGDDIIVSGIVIRRWRSIRNDERCDIEVVLLANYVRVMNEQKFSSTMTDDTRRQFEEFWLKHESEPLVGRNRIINQICSGVFGLFVVKLALLLILIGGVNIDLDNGTKKRGECHLLLVGEPGTGKSQFLKFASKVAQRAVLTTGIGTTTAGLTAASVKEPGSGEMVLEAGALVLADGGVCCIDEFSGIKTKDRATIHEAMEQQSLSIAKGGVISRLHTRTSIIAATNAKGKYDLNETLTVNTSLATPLLSRFDIILLLTDDKNVDWDREVSDFILRNAMLSSINNNSDFSSSNNNSNNNSFSSNTSFNNSEVDDFWNLDLLQSYIYYVKGNFKPKLTLESKQLIEAYYTRQRANVMKANESRTTVRLLESLIRLSQAHARLMFRNTVEVQDAIISIFMLESSVESNCIFANLNAQRSIFPDDPESDYKRLETKIKKALGLTNLNSRQLPRNISKRRYSNLNLNPNWVQNQLDHNDENEQYYNNNEEEQQEDEQDGQDGQDEQEEQVNGFEQQEEEKEENNIQHDEEQGFNDIDMNDQFEEQMQDYNLENQNEQQELQQQKEAEEKEKQFQLQQKEREEKEKQLTKEREEVQRQLQKEKEKEQKLQIEKERKIKLQKEKEEKEEKERLEIEKKHQLLQQQQQLQQQKQLNDDFYGIDENDDDCFQLSEASIVTPLNQKQQSTNNKINNNNSSYEELDFDEDEDFNSSNNNNISVKSKYFSNQSKTPDTQVQVQKDQSFSDTPIPSAQKQYSRFSQLTSQLSEFSQEVCNNNHSNDNNNGSSFDLDIFSEVKSSVINNGSLKSKSTPNNNSNNSLDIDIFEDILPSPNKPPHQQTKISNEEIVHGVSKLNTQDSLNITMSGQEGWSDDEEDYQPTVIKSTKSTSNSISQSQSKKKANGIQEEEEEEDFNSLDNWD